MAFLHLVQAQKQAQNKTWNALMKKGWLDGKPINPNNINIDGAHQGKPCAVIGSGYTGRGVDSLALKNIITIAINHTIEQYPKSDYLIFQDHRFLKLNKLDLDEYGGTIVVANSNPINGKTLKSKIVSFVPIQADGKVSAHFSGGLYSRISTGLCALNLAIVLGCKPIYLIGCDMPKDWRDTVDVSEGIHSDPNYRGAVDTILALEGYEKSLKLYGKFGKYADRIINVCENGCIDSFRQIRMDMFNKKIGEVKK